MAASNNDAMIQWSASDAKTVSANTIQDSDAYTLNPEDMMASVQVNADNQGTPASGDIVDVYAKWSNGNVDGSAGDDYDTDEHCEYLGRLDTYPTNTPGEDPARKTFDIRVGSKKYLKISAICPQAATRNIILRARINTKRMQ